MRTFLCCLALALLADVVDRGASADSAAPNSKPITITNFRRVSPDQIGAQFSWGADDELYYVQRHPAGMFIYSLNLSSNGAELITKGVSPFFRECAPVPGVESRLECLYFLRDIGYSIEKEFWRYDHFLATNTAGEHKDSGATLMISDPIYLSPADDRLFAYRYAVDMAGGGFQQIRVTQVKGYGDFSSRTSVLYSRSLGEEMPSISAWLDKDTLICFIRDEPYLLRVNFDAPVTASADWPTRMRHYPPDNTGYLVRGLGKIGQIVLPASNFAKDGKSYLVYSARRKSIIQKGLDGTEIGSTALPPSIQYYEFLAEQPVFSRDGRHIAFIGVGGQFGNEPRVYVGDVR